MGRPKIDPSNSTFLGLYLIETPMYVCAWVSLEAYHCFVLGLGAARFGACPCN